LLKDALRTAVSKVPKWYSEAQLGARVSYSIRCISKLHFLFLYS